MGLQSEYKMVQLPSFIDKKGLEQKRSKLLRVRSGVIGDFGMIKTPEDFYCKNWTQK